MDDNKKMKILMLVPDLQNKGPIIVMKTIIFSLKEEFEFQICSLRKNEIQDLEEYKKNRIPILELDMSTIPSVENFRELKRIVFENEIDILHIHCFWPEVISYFIKVRKIVTLHNNPFEDYVSEYGKWIGNIMAYMQQLIIRKCEVIAISNYVKEQILKHGLLNKITVIYNGIPAEIEIKKEKKYSTKIQIINISALNKIKDVKRTVAIFKHLYDENANYHLHIVGDGSEKEVIRKFIQENNLEKQVTMWGTLPYIECQELLSRCDILLFTSKNEGFGLAVIEAMRQKVVPVVNAIPVMREIISNEIGYICKTDQEFIESLLELSDIEKLEKMREKAQKYFKKHFTTEELKKEYKKVYCRL